MMDFSGGLSSLDLAIVAAYFVVAIAAGTLLAGKAAKGIFGAESRVVETPSRGLGAA